jgi:hypothetical protein
VHLQVRDYLGEPVVLGVLPSPVGPKLYDVIRIEEADGLIARVVNYCYCPDALRAFGELFGLEVAPWGYHQPPKVLVNMIATTTLPWGSEGIG